jgi:hypothetical protein
MLMLRDMCAIVVPSILRETLGEGRSALTQATRAHRVQRLRVAAIVVQQKQCCAEPQQEIRSVDRFQLQHGIGAAAWLFQPSFFLGGLFNGVGCFGVERTNGTKSSQCLSNLVY